MGIIVEILVEEQKALWTEPMPFPGSHSDLLNQNL